MNNAQLQALWIAAGGPAALAPVMAAIALAESSGNASNTTGDGGTSYGLWQIHDVHWAQLEQAGIISSPSDLTDPAINAAAAVWVWKDQGLNAWTTYKNGAYLAYLAGPVNPTGSGASITNASNAAAGAIATALTPATPWSVQTQTVAVTVIVLILAAVLLGSVQS